MKEPFPWIRLIIAILFFTALVAFFATYTARGQDTTMIFLSAETSYVGVEHAVTMSVHMQEPTQSFQGRFVYDTSQWRFSGVSRGLVSGLVDWHSSVSDTVLWALALAEAVIDIDSLLTFHLVPLKPSSGFFALSHLIFNERGNDGLTWVLGASEIRPRIEHPDFGVLEGYIHRDTVHSVIETRYVLRDLTGDVSCDGTYSVFDAALILQRIVGKITSWNSEDPEACPTPIVVELH